jgi:hypothetical protein
MGEVSSEDTELLRWFAERTEDLVVLVDPAGRCLHVNPAAARALELEPDAVEHGTLLESAHPEDREALRAALGRRRAAELEVRHAGASGSQTIAWSVQPFGSPEARGVALWARARHTSPLAPIALDTAAILHDVKNPISGLRFALAAVARELGEEETAILGNLVERLQKIERALRSALPPA